MAFMVWNESLLTGIDSVDREHRGLVDLLNQAAPMLAHLDSTDMHRIEPVLDRLLDYAGQHFRTEEALMLRLNMDVRARKHHEDTHAKFVTEVIAMAQACKLGREVTGDQLLSFLASWLILHILGEDQAMARQVRALEAGEEPSAAYIMERGAEYSPSPASISQAMVDVYTMLTRQNRELWLANRALETSRAQVRAQNDNLESLVRERTSELERLAEELRLARDTAEAGSQAKSRFLGIMSHELRTPMNAILGNARMLLGEGLDPSQQDLAKRVVQASDHLMELLGSILDYARLGAGAEPMIEEASVSLASWLRDVCHPGFARAKEKGLRVSIYLDPALPATIHCDSRLLQRIVGQFIDNSVKFTSKGEISVSAELVNEKADENPRLRISVTDSGIGIEPHVHSQVFRPFTQADDRPERRFEGLGLGLALAHEYARVLGGEVGFESTLGIGSKFWLELKVSVMTGQPSVVAEPTTQSAFPTNRGPIPQALRNGLHDLEMLLNACDIRAADCLAKIYPMLKTQFGDSADTLVKQVAEFDYEAAHSLSISLQTA